MLHGILGSPFVPNVDGAILFLEDVEEQPYRVDRMMSHLRLAGVLDAVANDEFLAQVRTTSDRHKRGVQAIVKQMVEKGDIYLGGYEGGSWRWLMGFAPRGSAREAGGTEVRSHAHFEIRVDFIAAGWGRVG